MPSNKWKQRKTNQENAANRYWLRTSISRQDDKPKRLNFTWQTSRLQQICQAANMMDVSLESFIRMAAYERAINVLKEAASEPILHERDRQWIDHRYSEYPSRRQDLLPVNWRWRQHALDIVKRAADATKTDYRTFIDVAAYDRATAIVGKENN
jgi:uncharacterized protein (DUF1778 family)